jgi:acyl-CoA thioester hydrolase
MNSLQTVWQGTANAWECDDMGHMNVRYYGAKIEDALAGFLADEGAATDAGGLIRAHHIRYQRECRAGTPLRIQAAALQRGPGGQIYFEVQGTADGQVKATFVTTLAPHVAMPDGPCMALPAHGAARGLPDLPGRPTPTLAEADAAGLTEITRTIIRGDQLDAAGALRPHHMIGMISDGVAHLMTRITPARGQHDAPEGTTLGGAALEQRVFCRAPVRAGDPVTIRSGIVDAGDKTMRIVHWLLNRRTGEAFATSEVIAVTFDLVARRAVSLPQEARDRIAAMRVTAEA